MQQKIDYKKQYQSYYNPSAKGPEIVTIPSFTYLMIDGVDANPDNPRFQNAIQTLFQVSYKTKFALKKTTGIDFGVMPLEGLWWADNPEDFIQRIKANWKWTLMIMQPEVVTKDMIEAAIADLRKGKTAMDTLDYLRLENFEEGLASQIMHIGPFSEEHPNIIKIHQLIAENGGTFDGQNQKHHEIYLSDFRKTAPERLKTVLRQPFIK